MPKEATIFTKIAKEIRNKCNAEGFQEKDILKLVIKYLGLYHEITVKPREGKLTDFEMRQKVWNFWHENSDKSTNTTDVVCMQVDEKPCIQSGLPFMSLVHQVVK